MIRPWQIAAGYLICVGLALLAMMAVTQNAIQLDRAEQESRLRAELEERIGGALWTMDAEVSSILAEELARPPRDFICEPVGLGKGKLGKGKPGKGKLGGQPSPLPGDEKTTTPADELDDVIASSAGATAVVGSNYTSAEELVLLRFRVDLDNNWESPQCDPHSGNGVRDSQVVEEAVATLQEIRDTVNFRQLAMTLPLPDDVRARLALTDSLPFQQQRLVNNSYAPQQTALRNESGRQQFGPDSEGLAQQQAAAIPQQSANQSIEAGDYPNQAIFPNRLAQRDASQSMARNSLIVRRLQAVQAILSADRSAEERWSNTLWVGKRLVLARMTIENDSTMILGVCLNWDHLRERLRQRVGDALPDFELQPIAEENEVLKHRALATLPVRVVTPPIDPTQFEGWTPIRVTLGLAWMFLSVAALAVGALLIGAVRLSERRASFVAAVTHELRSPLTTFQLYTEMLLGGMVRDDDRTTYLKTLKAESERLSHLVENVLQYSRLERGKHPSCDQQVNVDEMIERMAPRLAERLRQAGMELKVEDRSANALIQTDPGAVEQILYNLADNASKYAADGEPKRLQLTWSTVSGRLICEVRDFGAGIDEAGQRQLFRAFSKSVHEAAESAPGVGLDSPFASGSLISWAAHCGIYRWLPANPAAPASAWTSGL